MNPRNPNIRWAFYHQATTLSELGHEVITSVRMASQNRDKKNRTLEKQEISFEKAVFKWVENPYGFSGQGTLLHLEQLGSINYIVSVIKYMLYLKNKNMCPI